MNLEYHIVMKTLLATSLLLVSSIAVAQENPSAEQILGAIAGGAIGNSIGDGDGRKAATVVGAIIGYRMGEQILGSKEKYPGIGNTQSDFRRYCSSRVPTEYFEYNSLRENWVRGCIQRLNREQRELERQAYEDGLNGSTN